MSNDDRNPKTNGMRIPKPPAGTVYTPGRSQRTGEKVWTEQVQVYVTGPNNSTRRPRGECVGKDKDGAAVFTMSI